jgi:hypothetical protein
LGEISGRRNKRRATGGFPQARIRRPEVFAMPETQARSFETIPAGTDVHPGEPAIVHHYGKALAPVGKQRT